MGEDEKAATAPKESRKSKSGEKAGEPGEAHVKAAPEEGVAGGEGEEATNQPEEEGEEVAPVAAKPEPKKVKAHAPPETEKPVEAASETASSVTAGRRKSLEELMSFRRVVSKRRH